MDPIVIDQSLGFLESLSALLMTEVRRENGDREQTLIWDTDAVSGQVRQLSVRDGLDLTVMNVSGRVPWQAEMLHAPGGLVLDFTRSSSVRATSPSGMTIGLKARQMCLSRIVEPTPLTCVGSAGVDRGVSLHFHADHLHDVLGVSELPKELADFLEPSEPVCCVERSLSEPMLNVLAQVETCELQGPMRRLFMESKSLELTVLAIEELTNDSPEPTFTLSTADVEKLEYARGLIRQTFSTPPSLRSLAKHCGLNERKLKEGFKARFGTTVFGYVRQQRMERAHDLLSTQTRSVTEVAHCVGYSNPSKFAAAFRREFGIAPRHVAGN